MATAFQTPVTSWTTQTAEMPVKMTWTETPNLATCAGDSQTRHHAWGPFGEQTDSSHFPSSLGFPSQLHQGSQGLQQAEQWAQAVKHLLKAVVPTVQHTAHAPCAHTGVILGVSFSPWVTAPRKPAPAASHFHSSHGID